MYTNFKNIPVWVTRNLCEQKNCFVGKRTYKLIKEDLKNYFGVSDKDITITKDGYKTKIYSVLRVENGFIIEVNI